MKRLFITFGILGFMLVVACSKESDQAPAADEASSEPLRSSISEKLSGSLPVVPDYPADKITENTWVIHGPMEMPNPDNKGFMNNPVFVVTNESVVVLDPGSSVHAGEMVLRQIRKVTDKPVSHVFNSHIHGDHWLGNQAIHQAYPDVKIYAHPKMIEQAKAGEAESWVDLMLKMTDGATVGTKAVIPGNVLEDGKVYKVGNITFKAYLTDHAHTKTDAMIEIVEDSILVTGDNALNKRVGRLDDSSFRGNIAALDRASGLKLKHYVPGHGKTGDVQIISQYRLYLDTIYTSAGKFSEEGLADFEMKEKIAAQLEEFKSWSMFDEEFGKSVSLAVLEYEQAAFE